VNFHVDLVPASKARQVLLASMTEKEFAQAVVELAHLNGWMCAHFRPAMTGRVDKRGRPIWVTAVQADGAGYPDLTLVHPERAEIIFAELKKEGANPSPEQEEWLAALRACETETVVKVYVWHPHDLDVIAAILGNAGP